MTKHRKPKVLDVVNSQLGKYIFVYHTYACSSSTASDQAHNLRIGCTGTCLLQGVSFSCTGCM